MPSLTKQDNAPLPGSSGRQNAVHHPSRKPLQGPFKFENSSSRSLVATHNLCISLPITPTTFHQKTTGQPVQPVAAVSARSLQSFDHIGEKQAGMNTPLLCVEQPTSRSAVAANQPHEEVGHCILLKPRCQKNISYAST